MLRIFLLLLLFVWLFRFILRFVLPVFRITSAVRGQMRHMQQRQSKPSAATAGTQQKVRKGDYIDYEEVK